MHPETAFLARHALVLVLVAAGLGSLGRRSTHPWASRMLAASRPPAAEPVDAEDDWPHSEVPVFHLGLSGVALAAAVLLTAVSVGRHHGPIEVLAQLTLLLLIAARIARLISVRRALVAPQPNRPTGSVTRPHTEGRPRWRR